MSFLSALVQLKVFKEVSVNFLLVGHTGKKKVLLEAQLGRLTQRLYLTDYENNLS